MKIRKGKIIGFFFVTQFVCGFASAQSKTILWYNRPAEYFEEALVLGNGKTGATVFGGILSEQIFLNDATLWAGGPVDPNMNSEAYKNIPLIREALNKEDYRTADQLNKKVQGKFSESFAPLGTLKINFDHKRIVNQYYRELNIANAVAKVNYTIDAVKYSREYFVSYPDKVMIIKLSATEKNALNFTVKFNSLLKYSTVSGEGILQVNGYAPYHAEPDYRGNMPNAVVFDEKQGTRFSTYIKIKNVGGQVTVLDSAITVKGANEATLFISIATSFYGFDKHPVTQGLNNKKIAKDQLIHAYAKSYELLKENHRKDYQTFFNRVKFDLNDNSVPDLPTDERLKKYTQGTDDKNLEILYFQYGRYLLISSSRTKGVPANLQGIWNPYLRPPWSCNYTMNINAEENYWLAESANLSEMHMPFLTFINNLAQTGKVTAKTFYGVDRGWAACHNSDIWAMSNPVG